jgi:DNA adenine methylase
VKPAFAYYGGKTGLAQRIVSLMPAHRVYIEPFAGSAAVLVAKPPSTHEILNDVDGEIVNFFTVLRTRPDDLELACRLTPYSRDEYAAARAADPDELDPVERARRWWVLSTQSFGQTAKRGTAWCASVQRGSNNARSVWNRIGRFAAIAERLGPVVIENRDALEVIARYQTADAVIYCDPPYLGSTRSSYADGRRPDGDYPHEFATEAQHRALAELLHTSAAAVLLSGYPSDLYDELYAGWGRRDYQVVRRSSNGRSSGASSHVTECVWINRALPADRLAFL